MNQTYLAEFHGRDAHSPVLVWVYRDHLEFGMWTGDDVVTFRAPFGEVSEVKVVDENDESILMVRDCDGMFIAAPRMERSEAHRAKALIDGLNEN